MNRILNGLFLFSEKEDTKIEAMERLVRGKKKKEVKETEEYRKI